MTHTIPEPPAQAPAVSKSKRKSVSNGAESKKGVKLTSQNLQAEGSVATAETRRESFSHNSTEETTFRLDAPAAREVLLAGEFTGWEKSAIKLTKGGGGVWHTKVALAPGRHQYRFLVDGQWQDDQNRPEREPNPFGTTNSVVEIK